MLDRKQLVKVVSLALTFLAIAFSFVYFRSLTSALQLADITINFWLLILSFSLFIVFYILLSINWYRISETVDQEVDRSQMLSFFASQPYKYLPSSLFTFSFRAKYSKDLGMNVKDSSFAQLFENLVLVVVGLLVAAYAYIFSLSLLLGFIAVGVAFVVAAVLPKSFKVRIRSYKKTVQKKQVLSSCAIVILAWIIAGVSFFLLIKALSSSNDGVFLAISANSFAYTSGILAFFAPGGVGVRELVYEYFAVVSISIIAWRLLTFIIDMLTGISAIIIVELLKKRNT